jgi:hypothetical protein
VHERREAEDNSRDQGDSNGEEEHRGIETDLVCPWNRCFEADPRDAQSTVASSSPNAAPTTESNSPSVTNWEVSRRKLAPIAPRIAISRLPSVRSRQKEIGHIHARDEQHETDGAQQHSQGGLDASHHDILQSVERERMFIGSKWWLPGAAVCSARFTSNASSAFA